MISREREAREERVERLAMVMDTTATYNMTKTTTISVAWQQRRLSASKEVRGTVIKIASPHGSRDFYY